MSKKNIILTLTLLLAGTQANSMSYLRRFTPAAAGVIATTAVTNSYCSGLPEKVDSKGYPELAKFIKKYRCSASDEINQDHHFVKYDFERIINAERMKNIIKQEGLDHLQVAEKCLCKTDGARWCEVNCIWFCSQGS